jgi:catechol 2,3-dioxygenase-like lactoylglutathione lyase family enzyme
MPIKVEAVDHLAINVTDVPRAKNFYEKLLGLEEIDRPESFKFPGAWYRVGTFVIHLVGTSTPDAERSSHYCLWVEDVHGTCKTLEAAGFPIKWETLKIPGIDRFFTRDPDGNRIEFQGSDGTTFAA